jgi:hypothetical protein
MLKWYDARSAKHSTSSHSDENPSPVLRDENFNVTKALEITVLRYEMFCRRMCGYRHASKKLTAFIIKGQARVSF